MGFQKYGIIFKKSNKKSFFEYYKKGFSFFPNKLLIN